MKMFSAYTPAPWHFRIRRALWWLFVVPRVHKPFIPPWGPLRASERDMAYARKLAAEMDAGRPPVSP